MRRVRQRIAARRSLFLSVYWASAATAAAALYFAVTTNAILAVASCVICGGLRWLSGASPWPRSVDAYLKRMTTIWRAWEDANAWSYNIVIRERSMLVDRIAALSPPREWAEAHTRVVTTSTAIRPTSEAGSAELASRVRRVLEALGGVTRIRDELQATGSTDAHHRYVAALDAALAKYAANTRSAMTKAEQASVEALRKVIELRPPAPAETQHETMIDAFNSYLRCSKDFHAACERKEPLTAASLADELVRRDEDVRLSVDALNRVLAPEPN